MSDPICSIIIPTRKRSQFLVPRLRLLEKNTPELSSGEAELLYAYDSDDEETIKVLEDEPYRNNWSCEPLTTPANKWNLAAKCARGEWLVTMSDDSAPHPNWLTHALRTKNYGFLALPDGKTGDRNKQFTPLYMATKEWLKQVNGGVLVIPVYGIWYADIETCLRAHRTFSYTLAVDSVVEQLHADYGTAPDDEIYQIGRSRRIQDLKTFEERKSLGFPDDFKPCL